ncbi:hypothetical protein AVEN_215403-1 [Araneus ventricosus]|uniref:Mos1 transposase HTH domain-containing protein n=1 Tax=Araneus ventricosus TaxID=182803 RepID=A0A4Y2GJL2_ARAVE|nr:hypothetical protein AVEN_215403-1 [Araneus ventricosus]
MVAHQYPHFCRVVSAVRCMMDSSRSAQSAVFQFLRAEEEHASQIYSRMKEVYREQYLARCNIFRWCQQTSRSWYALDREHCDQQCHDFGCG